MSSTAKKDVVTVEAELTVTSPLGSEQIRTFGRAWARTQELPMPTSARFKGWARIEKK